MKKFEFKLNSSEILPLKAELILTKLLIFKLHISFLVNSLKLTKDINHVR